MDWKQHYNSRMISAEEAARFVKSGDRVMFTAGREAHGIGLAIAARKEELRNVEIIVPTAGYDFGWYDPGWEESFAITAGMPVPMVQKIIDERRCDILFSWLYPYQSREDVAEEPVDVLLTEISTPNEHGFCSFGASLWDKKKQIGKAKLVLGEVNEKLIRTYGHNFIHVSEIDYFVEHISSGSAPGTASLTGRTLREPEEYVKRIAENVSELIKDRATIQIGVGRVNEYFPRLGVFDNKQDLGYHSEATPPGIINLVRKGVFTGKYKNINRGKVVVAALGGSSREEMMWVHNNPLFEVVDIDYLEDIRTIASHDNFVAINQALAIDITGQLTSETIGTRTVMQAGGQTVFVIGALLSKGGRSIHVVPSTAAGGTQSRIVPMLEPGTVVTIPRNCVDYVVTEWGVARLWGKTHRQRARELINIAHPDFRAELTEEMKRRFYP